MEELLPSSGSAGSAGPSGSSHAASASSVVPPAAQELIVVPGLPGSAQCVIAADDGVRSHHTEAGFDATQHPAWSMVEDALSPVREHELESLFAVSNGFLGRRGTIPMGVPPSSSTMFLAGLYDRRQPDAALEGVSLPGWTLLSLAIDDEEIPFAGPTRILDHRRALDLRQGLFRRWFRFADARGRVTAVRFFRMAAMGDRHLLWQSSLCIAENYAGPVTVRSGFPVGSLASLPESGLRLRAVTTDSGPIHLLEKMTRGGQVVAVAAAARLSTSSHQPTRLRHTACAHANGLQDEVSLTVEAGQAYRLDWVEVVHTAREHGDPARTALAHCASIVRRGVKPPLAAHRRNWQEHWYASDVHIDGDDAAQKALRFACYHLISAANAADEHASIGARALTGPAYKGHVFWDTEIFLLPFYTLTHPAAARALLMYRFHTLDAARAKARAKACRGAFFAWESADSGEDVTPSFAINPLGTVAPVVTGRQAVHISADIAWAAWQYWVATGDDDFLHRAGAELICECARFYASRVELGADGLFHLCRVIGPDEYHEAIDDNAYTNWMAQWTLQCAADLAQRLAREQAQTWRGVVGRIGLDASEPDQWRMVAARIATGIDAARGLIAQFAGYFALDDIDFAHYAPRSLPIDVVLGRETTQRNQVVKQADVVMLLQLLWDRIPGALREASFRYYEPRTEHGSSLSPGTHALVAARLGDMETALRYFRQGWEIDLADNMGNAAGGVHIAALGGLWQAVVFGFAGLSFDEHGLRLAPHCPPEWKRLAFALHWRGRRLRIEVSPARMAVTLLAGAALLVRAGEEAAEGRERAGEPVMVDTGWRVAWEAAPDGWREVGRERH